MSSSKNNLPVKGFGNRCLLEFIDWKYSQHVGIFYQLSDLLPLLWFARPFSA